MKPFEMMEHTADIRIRARGATLAQLFINAASGMAAYLFGEKLLEAAAKESEVISISSSDPEALLVDWLSELLLKSTAERRAYVRFEMQQITSNQLKARCYYLPARAVEDIKAVTYHELAISEGKEGLEAAITFDI